MEILRNGQQIDGTILSNNKERLTIEWLQQSIGELRKQLVELQQIASNAMRDVTTRTQSWEDLATIRSDFQQLKLELAALKERQQQSDVYIQELREESEQQEEEFQHFIIQNKQITTDRKQPQQQRHQLQDTINLSGSSSESLDENIKTDIKEVSLLHGFKFSTYRTTQGSSNGLV